jgi:phosphoglycerate dehydrogenase-like enzyme
MRNQESLWVIGLGNIGKEVARIGLSFGMKVVAWSQNLRVATVSPHIRAK